MLLVCENEVDPSKRYFVREMRRHLPAHRVYDYVREGGRPSLDGVDGVVLAGSTAGVYESDDHPWMDDERAFVRELVDRGVPTLGVCFGHQLVNDALGGTVEHVGLTAEFVDVELADDPLFADVRSRIPLVHGDQVTSPGATMEPIAAADYYPYLATRHREAPVWTVQYHPEFTDRLVDRIAADFEWHDDRTFEGVTAVRTLDNFAALAGAGTDGRDDSGEP
jgi:GMP synthase (glutamine-hydrolysing)